MPDFGSSSRIPIGGIKGVRLPCPNYRRNNIAFSPILDKRHFSTHADKCIGSEAFQAQITMGLVTRTP